MTRQPTSHDLPTEDHMKLFIERLADLLDVAHVRCCRRCRGLA